MPWEVQRRAAGHSAWIARQRAAACCPLSECPAEARTTSDELAECDHTTPCASALFVVRTTWRVRSELKAVLLVRITVAAGGPDEHEERAVQHREAAEHDALGRYEHEVARVVVL
jgi:hypothetical protein